MRLFRGLMLVFVVLAVVGLCNCGQSGSKSVSRTSTLVLRATSTAPGNPPISAIDVTFTLPEGMSVTTTGSTSQQIASDAVVASTNLSGTNIVSGSYSLSNRVTHLSFVTTSDNYTGGEFLRLTCNMPAKTKIALDSIRTATPVTVVKAVGYDPGSKSTVAVTNSISVNLEVL